MRSNLSRHFVFVIILMLVSTTVAVSQIEKTSVKQFKVKAFKYKGMGDFIGLQAWAAFTDESGKTSAALIVTEASPTSAPGGPVVKDVKMVNLNKRGKPARTKCLQQGVQNLHSYGMCAVRKENGGYNYATGWQVQNVDTARVEVKVQYYDGQGDPVGPTTTVQTGTVVGDDEWIGSAAVKLTGTSGGAIVAYSHSVYTFGQSYGGISRTSGGAFLVDFNGNAVQITTYKFKKKGKMQSFRTNKPYIAYGKTVIPGTLNTYKRYTSSSGQGYAKLSSVSTYAIYAPVPEGNDWRLKSKPQQWATTKTDQAGYYSGIQVMNVGNAQADIVTVYYKREPIPAQQQILDKYQSYIGVQNLGQDLKPKGNPIYVKVPLNHQLPVDLTAKYVYYYGTSGSNWVGSAVVSADQPIVGRGTGLYVSSVHLKGCNCPASPEPAGVANNTEILANILVLDLQNHTLEQVGQLNLKAKERDALENPTVIPFGDKIIYYVQKYNFNTYERQAFTSVIPASSIFD